MKRFFIAALLMPTAASACGPDTDCILGERTYRIQMPTDAGDGPLGAILYSHGYGGSAKAAMRNKSLRDLADELGMALVATKSASKDWLIPGVPENPSEDGMKEFAYYDALIDELENRFNIDRTRLVATGFSAGGMMVWNLACHRGDAFAAFIPVAGTFWEPVPTSCPSGPVNMVHIHGTADKIVPLAGRRIQQTKQGNVNLAMDRAVAAGQFGNPLKALATFNDLYCKKWMNADGKLLAFCQHPGGHSIKMNYLRAAWTMLQEADALKER